MSRRGKSRRPCSSSEADRPDSPGSGSDLTSSLRYDVALPYVPAANGRPQPLLRVAVEFFAEQTEIVKETPILDSGAEISVFDRRVAQQARWGPDEVVRRALDRMPLHGLARRGRAVEGYLHDITCYVGLGARFVELRLRALITAPNTIAFPVLGRAGFFEQVDVTFSEFEKMLYLRFRNPAVRRFLE